MDTPKLLRILAHWACATLLLVTTLASAALSDTTVAHPASATPTGVAAADGVSDISALELTRKSAEDTFATGSALQAAYVKMEKGPDSAEIRGILVVPMLKAIKILDANGITGATTAPEIPDIVPIPNMVPNSGPLFEAAQLRYDSYVASMERARLIGSLVTERALMIHGIAEYYADPPDAVAELRQSVTSVLGSEAVAQELAAAVDHVKTARAAMYTLHADSVNSSTAPH